MAKGPQKDSKNKALHTKLLKRKKAKVEEEKKEGALKLKEIITKMNEQKKSNGGESPNG